ncbi:hypothetical protein B0H19DRAFT_1081551 [Mycena capillaripes]|nr:hypothetical protein B0H19DRAFT_1081551 [Mycena capillaripes]
MVSSRHDTKVFPRVLNGRWDTFDTTLYTRLISPGLYGPKPWAYVSGYHPLTFGAHLCPSQNLLSTPPFFKATIFSHLHAASGSFRNSINTHAPPHRKAASPLPLPGPSPCRGAPLDLREVLAAGQRCGRVRPARTHDADAKRRVDANKDVFVVIAHDETLPDVIGPFPVLLYDWKAKGLKDRVLKAFVDEANPAFRFNDKV